uniref:Phosphofructokinase domain-containing protein n=1 Tax=Compsopogon caeruleus TaxID=31354 RepID=A0A7S1XCF7_9RHOD
MRVKRLPDSGVSYPSPLLENPVYDKVHEYFVEEGDAVVVNTVINERDLVCREGETALVPKMFERAGPRDRVVFDADQVHAAIVSCGGVCPGINTIIKEITRALERQYHVKRISGVPKGYRGIYGEAPWMKLSYDDLAESHRLGGTLLGTSRGGFDLDRIVNNINKQGVNQLYIIGGDGTVRGAQAIADEVERRGMRVAVSHIPKTIDNDLVVIDKSFGFDTAVEEAQRAIYAANVEVKSFPNAVGIVKLMGRSSGFIAMNATLSSGCVDCCLIPESPFDLDKLLEFIREKISTQNHCLVVVAEGAGQDYVGEFVKLRDASGNRLLGDIGLFLSTKVKEYFEDVIQQEVTVKYIDPTYMVRAIPANASDNLYCTLLSHAAVHGVNAGFTAFMTGPVNGKQCYIPLSEVVGKRNAVDTRTKAYARLISSTGQPSF